jgi:hypothetical protein
MVLDKKKTLQDVGTRWEHLSDLLDNWSIGVEVVRQSYARYPNDKDKLRLAQLEAAVKIIKMETDRLAEYDQKQWRLQDEINRIPKNKWVPDAKTNDIKTTRPNAEQSVDQSEKRPKEGENGDETPA